MIIITPWHGITETFKVRVCEYMLASITLMLGLMFYYNSGMFSSNADAFARLVFFASQPTWSIFCTVVGGARIAVLLVNGAYWRTPHARSAFAFINIFLWYQLSAGLIPNAAIGAAVFPVFIVADFYNAVRAAREAATAEVKHEMSNGQRPTIHR